jgi:hypothetical protein
MRKEESHLELEVKESFLRRAFKQEWLTMGNRLISFGFAIGAAAGFSHFASNFTDSDEILTTGATIIDSTVFWGTLIPQLYFRDKKRLLSEGKDISEIRKNKVKEYSVFATLMESSYLISRWLGQYSLQKINFEPATASLITQSTLLVLYTPAVPIIKYALSRFSEKE